MAISFVAAGAVSTGANPTVVVPAGLAPGDMLLLVTSGKLHLQPQQAGH